MLLCLVNYIEGLLITLRITTISKHDRNYIVTMTLTFLRSNATALFFPNIFLPFQSGIPAVRPCWRFRLKWQTFNPFTVSKTPADSFACVVQQGFRVLLHNLSL